MSEDMKKLKEEITSDLCRLGDTLNPNEAIKNIENKIFSAGRLNHNPIDLNALTEAKTLFRILKRIDCL